MKPKLLLADDSTLVRKNLKRLLGEIPPLQILESRDAVSTINEIVKENPQILLLDLRMPNGSGFDVLKFLKEYESKPLIIVLTNSSSDEIRDLCLTAGADFFFDKSKQHKEAVAEIKNAVKTISEKEEFL